MERLPHGASSSGAVNVHVIWGGVELSNDTTDSAAETPEEQDPALEEAERPQVPQSSRHRIGSDAQRRPLSEGVQQYLHSVVFNADSLSADHPGAESLSAEGDRAEGSDAEDPAAAAAGEGGKKELWSMGSALHESGKCRPCHYVNSRTGCVSGAACEFCHLDHQKKNRPRPCRSKRVQCKRIASMLEEMTGSDPEQFQEAAKVLSSQSTYLKKILKNRTKAKGEQGEADAAEASSAVSPAKGNRMKVSL